MEGELLSSSSASALPKKKKTIAELFEEYCPMYLDAGMPYELYWDGDVEAVKPYREVLERRRRWQNQMLHLQGRYIYDALRAIMPACSIKFKTQIGEYTDKPYPLTDKELRERREQEEKEQYYSLFNYMLSQTKEQG